MTSISTIKLIKTSFSPNMIIQADFVKFLYLSFQNFPNFAHWNEPESKKFEKLCKIIQIWSFSVDKLVFFRKKLFFGRNLLSKNFAYSASFWYDYFAYRAQIFCLFIGTPCIHSFIVLQRCYHWLLLHQTLATAQGHSFPYTTAVILVLDLVTFCVCLVCLMFSFAESR